MCNRFHRIEDLRKVAGRFRVRPAELPLEPQYNIAPSEKALVILPVDQDREFGLRAFGLKLRWMETPLMNIRAESFVSKPTFRPFLEKRRAIVPADGFYEWRRSGKKSIPFRFTLRGGGLFGMAAVVDQDGFALVTTEANQIVRDIHHRMPVLLRPGEEDRWLDSSVREFHKLMPLLAPYPSEEMAVMEVSTALNSARDKSPSVIEPPKQQRLFE